MATAPKSSASKASSMEYLDIHGVTGSAASAAKTSALLQERILFKDAFAAEKPAGSDYEDHDHDPEDGDGHALGVHPERQQALGDADDEGGDHGAAHGTHPAEYDHDEREQDHLDAHLRVHGEDGREQEPGEGGQGRRAGEGQREDARHVDAEAVEHLGVLDRRPDDDPGAGPGEEEPDAEQEERGEGEQEEAVLRIGHAEERDRALDGRQDPPHVAAEELAGALPEGQREAEGHDEPVQRLAAVERTERGDLGDGADS